MQIYRKRLIPDECILLKDDEILEIDEDYIVTKWKTLKPRRDFSHGYSCYFLKLGFKISKFFREDNSLLYWYCDIVDYSLDKKTDTLTVTDLLADIVIYPDGYTKVLDLDELALALEKNLCAPSTVTLALKRLNTLLNIIYDDKLDALSNKLDKWTKA